MLFHTNINFLFQNTFDVLVGALGSLCILRYTSIYKIEILSKIMFKIFKLNPAAPLTKLQNQNYS